MLKIGFIGGGKMAQALAKGFIAAGFTKSENMIASCHPSDIQNAEEFKKIGAESIFENPPVVQKSDVVIVSVKPSAISAALGDIKRAGINESKLYLSIAMGITIKELEKSRVIRLMPNTPCLVQQGATVYVPGSRATKTDVMLTKKLLKTVGTIDEVSESLLDPVTALSGSGPAYVYIFIEALADGGVKMGLPRDLAYKLAAQTVLGAGKMVLETQTHPGMLKDNVASPMGSTITGLHYLEDKGFRGAVIGAVESATLRCRQVSEGLK